MVTRVGRDQFIVLTWLGDATFGIFITESGDPCPDRGTLEWPAYPLGICESSRHKYQPVHSFDICLSAVDANFVYALLPDGSIHIHDITREELVQKIPSQPHKPGDSDPTSLVSSQGYLVPSLGVSAALQTRIVPVLPRPDEPSSGSGLTPPSNPMPLPYDIRHKRLPSTSSIRSIAALSHTRSSIVILGSRTLSSLVPQSLLDNINALLEVRKLDDAVGMVELEWARRGLHPGSDSDQVSLVPS